MKEMKKLENYKIYCSEKCEKEHLHISQMENEITRLRGIIYGKNDIIDQMKTEKDMVELELTESLYELKNEMGEKEKFFNLQYKSHKDFEDMAFEMEQKLTNEALESKNKIISLQKKLNSIIEENESLEKRIKDFVEITNKLEQDLTHMIDLNKNMVSTIRLLEQEKEVSTNKEKECKQKCRNNGESICRVSDNQVSDKEKANEVTVIISNDLVQKEKISKNGRNHCSETRQRNKSKLLLIGDETVKDLASYVNSFHDFKFTVEGVSMPEVEVATLAKSIFKYSNNYGENDFIICMFKTINVSNYRHLNTALRHLLPLSRVTNLLIMSKRTNFNDFKIEYFIHKKINQFQSTHKNTSLKYFSNVVNIKSLLRTIIIKEYSSELSKSFNKIVLRSVPISNVVSSVRTSNNFFQKLSLQKENIR